MREAREEEGSRGDASNVSAFARAACVAIESSSGKMAAMGKGKKKVIKRGSENGGEEKKEQVVGAGSCARMDLHPFACRLPCDSN